MTSLQKLKEFGESIGLKGEGLHTFIKEQQAEVRELEQQRDNKVMRKVRKNRKNENTARIPQA